MSAELQRHGKMPAVGAVMTRFPYFVGPDDRVQEVERLMQEHGIRHVPVLSDGRVVGIVSERDLHRIVNPALPSVDKERIRVRAVQLRDPYVVDIATPLAEVLSAMAARRIGSAIVLRREKLAGVLSSTDACRLLAELLESIHAQPGDDAA
jgi:acetoin utilization protein AcuB